MSTRPGDVAPAGLSSVEAARRLERDGPNVLVPEERGHRLRRLVGPFADPMVLLLLVAAPTYLLIGEVTDAVVAFAALAPVAGVGWLLEARAERTLEQLRRQASPVARVRRDGALVEVRAGELVVGDLVVVHEGDLVPADGAVVEASELVVDESSLTGEALPVVKVAGGGPEEAGVWAGTTVLSGRAVVEVAATGARTRYARIGELVAGAGRHATPFQVALRRLVWVFGIVAVVFCTAVVAAELAHGAGWGDAVIAGVSLAIAAIPEEFSMVYALYLALGAWRLSQHRALVRSLPSVETLGSTTVICTDKTGTLTEGRLVVHRLWAPGVGVSGEALRPAEVELLEAAVLACEPDPFDPLDLAIVAFAEQHGVDVAALHAGELVADWPFDPVGKHLVHVWRHAPGRHRTAAKGSIEGISARTGADAASRAAADEANARFASAGMRVIAVAGRAGAAPTGDRARDEEGLAFLGLVAFEDPIREGVSQALQECRDAGIRVIMITGDHPATAHAVAEGLDLPHEADGQDVIASGDDLDRPDAPVDELVARANVFARTRPEHKHLLVSALRRQGHVVAMTGDGINDAPALREADIGVAMGRRGTEVARSAASLVLLDDNFATIVHAVRDGRRIFDNLSRAFAYLISFHPPLLLAALLVPLLDRPLLLLPVHLVVLELLLHPVVSLVFQADPADPDAMHRPPRPAGDALRLRAMWRPYAIGLALAAGILAEYLIALHVGWPVEQARALGFCTLLASQPFLVLGARSPDRPIWRPGRAATPTLAIGIAVIVATTLAVVYVPPVAELLRLEAFPRSAWAAVVGVAAVTTLWSEPVKHAAA